MNTKINPHADAARQHLQQAKNQDDLEKALVALAITNAEATLALVWELEQRRINTTLEGERHIAPLAKSGNGGEQATIGQIPVEGIKLATRSDKAEHDRWVVIGGPFKQFGVTVWPETLEAAGIKVANLNDRGENKPNVALVAIYSEKENNQGKMVPDKVIEIRNA